MSGKEDSIKPNHKMLLTQHLRKIDTNEQNAHFKPNVKSILIQKIKN